MTALTNASQALLRNRDLLQGRVGFIGLTGPGLLAELSFSESPLVICEHAGTFARLQAADRCQPGHWIPWCCSCPRQKLP